MNKEGDILKSCPNCGEQVQDDKKFCPKCGASLIVAKTENNNSSGSKNILIIAVALIICVAIIAGAFVMMNNNSSDTVTVVNDNDSDDSDDSVESSDEDSSDSNSVNFDEAMAMYSDADSVLMTIAFNEAESNGDDLLTGDEISEFKRLAKLGIETGDASLAEAHDEIGPITRYCTTHGRVTTGDDFKCPYCQAEGVDARTLKGSTEYN